MICQTNSRPPFRLKDTPVQATTFKTTAVFLKAFAVPSLNEVLPAGEYAVQVELQAPPGLADPERWKASVLVHLHPTPGSPGLSRALTIPLADLEHALAKDKLSGQPLADFVLEEMLADPMVRLFMQSDGVTEEDVRRLHSRPYPRDGANG
jgi:hypothetical protein